MARYYEVEIPESVVTEFGEFKYYKEAKKLQVSLPKWKSLDDEIHHGKTVTLDMNDFKGNEELKTLLNMVLAEIG
ncbi:MAG: hypothetical protein FNP40_13970 [Dehalobacter sp. 4CP]|uniref:hypothetical protein n=1 Tax=Dehalobacter sp. CP TaxID=2594474 RepID=UPI0013C9363E|nr:hypothetical protein [Dehalobacter sp. 4CP]